MDVWAIIETGKGPKPDYLTQHEITPSMLPKLGAGYYWRPATSEDDPELVSGRGVVIDKIPYAGSFRLTAQQLKSIYDEADQAQGRTGQTFAPGTAPEFMRKYGVSEEQIAKINSPQYKREYATLARGYQTPEQEARARAASEAASQVERAGGSQADMARAAAIAARAVTPSMNPAPPTIKRETQAPGPAEVDTSAADQVTKDFEATHIRLPGMKDTEGIPVESDPANGVVGWNGIPEEYQHIGITQGYAAMTAAIDKDSQLATQARNQYNAALDAVSRYKQADDSYDLGAAVTEKKVSTEALVRVFGPDAVTAAKAVNKVQAGASMDDLRNEFKMLTPAQKAALPDVVTPSKVGPFTVIGTLNAQIVRFGLSAIPVVNEVVFWNEMSTRDKAIAIGLDILIIAGPWAVVKAVGAIRGAGAAAKVIKTEADLGLEALKAYDSSLSKPVKAVLEAKQTYIADRMNVADLQATADSTRGEVLPEIQRSLDMARANAQDSKAVLMARTQKLSTKLLESKPFEAHPLPQVQEKALKAIRNLPQSTVDSADSVVENAINPKLGRTLADVQADLKQAMGRLRAAQDAGYNTGVAQKQVNELRGELLARNTADIRKLESEIQTLRKVKGVPEAERLLKDDQVRLKAAYKKLAPLEVEGEARGGISTAVKIRPTSTRELSVTTADGSRLKIGVPVAKMAGGTGSQQARQVKPTVLADAIGTPLPSRSIRPVTRETTRPVTTTTPGQREKETADISPASVVEPVSKSASKVRISQSIQAGENIRTGMSPDESPVSAPKPQTKPQMKTKQGVKTRTEVKQSGKPVTLPKSTPEDKAELISRAARDGAITWKQGALHGRPMYKLWVYPYSEGDFTTVGFIPRGANLVSGPGSARKTAAVLRGKAPSEPKMRDIGAFIATVSPSDGGKKIELTFKPDTEDQSRAISREIKGGPSRAVPSWKEQMAARRRIKERRGAIGWVDEKTHDGKAVYHILLPPYQTKEDLVTLVGGHPVGASLSTKGGPKAAYAGIQLLFGQKPSEGLRKLMGVEDFTVTAPVSKPPLQITSDNPRLTNSNQVSREHLFPLERRRLR